MHLFNFRLKLFEKIFFRGQFQNREVNSFQFPDDDSRNGRDSPELGIREVNFFFF